MSTKQSTTTDRRQSVLATSDTCFNFVLATGRLGLGGWTSGIEKDGASLPPKEFADRTGRILATVRFLGDAPNRKWSTPVEMVGRYILDGGQTRRFLEGRAHLLADRNGDNSIFKWCVKVWKWLMDNTDAIDWLNVCDSQDGFQWSGPDVKIKCVEGPGEDNTHICLGWDMELPAGHKQEWISESISRRLAAAAWLGMLTSIQRACCRESENDEKFFSKQIVLASTGLNADLLGTDIAPHLGFTEIDRLWIELGRFRLEPNAPAGGRATHALRALHLALSTLNQGSRNQDTPLPIFQGDITTDGRRLIKSLDDFGLAPRPELDWAKASINGVLTRHRAAIPADIAAGLAKFASRA